jgi:hypothetical protein
MKFTKTLLAVALAGAAMSAQAASQPLLNTSNFQMFDSDGAFVGGAAAPSLTGFIDTDAGTWNVASTVKFFGGNWTASGGTLFGPGTYTLNINGDGSDELPFDAAYPLANGDGDYTFTVGAGQLGGNINFAWGPNSGIDVFQVWDIATVGGVTTYTSTNFDGDAILGGRMVDGAFPGFSANFNLAVAAVPEASTYGMMLAGLGLVGFAVRRRKLMA